MKGARSKEEQEIAYIQRTGGVTCVLAEGREVGAREGRGRQSTAGIMKSL